MAKITSRAEDYSKWYNELVVQADLAENSGVRGCMVIKPYGYAIWEKMRDELDKKFKETGHQNAYFPLFIPKSYFEAEEQNAGAFVVAFYLISLASKLAGKVKKSRKPVTISNMSARDRRTIHLALKDDPALLTKSRGEGAYRKIVIIPSKKEKEQSSP